MASKFVRVTSLRGTTLHTPKCGLAQRALKTSRAPADRKMPKDLLCKRCMKDQGAAPPKERSDTAARKAARPNGKRKAAARKPMSTPKTKSAKSSSRKSSRGKAA